MTAELVFERASAYYIIVQLLKATLELYDVANYHGETNHIAVPNEAVVWELERLIKSARTVSPVGKLNLSDNR